MLGNKARHVVMWKNKIFPEKANPANIHIYSDGSVKDNRWYINTISSLFFGGGYE